MGSGDTLVTVPYTYPGNGENIGIHNDSDVYVGGDVDVQMLLRWNAAADTNSETVGPSVWDVSGDPDTPLVIGNMSDRNFNRIQPGRISAEGSAGLVALTNALNTASLSGGELTADGTTVHTIGFSINGDNWRSFFDDTEKDNFTLTAAELLLLADVTRVGVFWSSASVPVQAIRILSLEIAPANDIYDPP